MFIAVARILFGSSGLSWGKLPHRSDRPGFGDSILDEKPDLHREPRFFRDLAEPTGTPYFTWARKRSDFLLGSEKTTRRRLAKNYRPTKWPER